MPITGGQGGSVTVTGNAINYYQVFTVRQGLKVYRDCGGILLTRGATPKRLLAIASKYTGATYPNTIGGREQCLVDLSAILAADPDRCVPDGGQG